MRGKLPGLEKCEDRGISGGRLDNGNREEVAGRSFLHPFHRGLCSNDGQRRELILLQKVKIKLAGPYHLGHQAVVQASFSRGESPLGDASSSI